MSSRRDSRAPRRAATTSLPEFQPLQVEIKSVKESWGPPSENELPAPPSSSEPFSLFNPPLEALASITEEDFKRAFASSPIRRAKYRGWLRNLCVVMGNSGDRRFIPWLEAAAGHSDPLVREHAGVGLAQAARDGFETITWEGRLANPRTAPMTCLPGKLLYGVKSLLDLRPVHHIPPRGKVLIPPVLILQVVGVLPDVDAHDGEFALHNRTVLIGGGVDFQLAAVGNQPCPSGAKAAHGGSTQFLFESCGNHRRRS